MDASVSVKNKLIGVSVKMIKCDILERIIVTVTENEKLMNI